MMARSRPRATTAHEGEESHQHMPPRDTVRRVSLTGNVVALVGFDADAKSRMTVLVDADDLTPELARTVLRWVRKMYPREALHMDRTTD